MEQSETLILEKPTLLQLEDELRRSKEIDRIIRILMTSVSTLMFLSALSVLIVMLVTPVLSICGSCMAPTISEGEVIMTLKTDVINKGDIIAFYNNNEILIRRVIGTGGEWINIDNTGVVYVNGEQLNEPYISDLSLGDCDIQLPYQIPDQKIFVLGDHRSTSVDSRNSALGCITKERLIGKVIFRIWPLNKIGTIR